MRLLALVDRFPSRRVAVVGDLLADEFIYGRVERVSREAPVLILRYDTTMVVPGGAGNAANNVAALGGRVAAGRASPAATRPGRRMLDALHARVSRTQVLAPAAYDTPVKTRILAGGVHSAKQQVVRIDRITNGAPDSAMRRAFEARVLAVARRRRRGARVRLRVRTGDARARRRLRRALWRAARGAYRSSWTRAMRCRTSTA